MQTMMPAGRTQVTTPVEVSPELEQEIRAIGTGRRRGLWWAVAALVIAVAGVIWWQVAANEPVEIHDSWMNVPVAQANFTAPEIHDSWDNVPLVEASYITEIHDSWAFVIEPIEAHDSWETVTP